MNGEVLEHAWNLLSNLGASSAAIDAMAEKVLADEVSASLLEPTFELEPLPSSIGGFALGSERLDEDIERRLLGKPTPCVGRERELALLESVLTECKEELLARAVLVISPPGLGKSRLRREFVRRLERHGEKVTILMGRGDPLKAKSAYGMLGEAVRRQLGISDGQALKEQQVRIRERIGARLPVADAQRVTVFWGELCGVHFSHDENPQLKAARQDPRVMSDQVEQAFLDGLRMLCTDEPLLLVLEDLQWSDALTVKLVDVALKKHREQALMVLALARPEIHDLYPNLWAGGILPLPLHPLARKASDRLVRQVMGPELPSLEVARMVEQSAGSPLFLEELIRACVERKTGGLPETVAAIIQARIGRLPASVRRALRAASIFGETLWEKGVQRLLATTHGEEPIYAGLEALVRDEILEKTPECRFAAEVQYRFRHSLVRDAAYGLVSAEERAAWHTAAVAFLESIGERDAATLAEHAERGSDWSAAIRYYTKAAQQAYAQNDLDGTLSCAQRGVACGAEGEALGMLRALQTQAAFWRDDSQAALQYGLEGLKWVPTGSTWMFRICGSMVTLAGMLGQQEIMQDAISRLLRVEPTSDALADFVEQAAALMCSFCVMGLRGPANILLPRMQRVAAQLPANDLVSQGWFHYALSWYLRFMEQRPWDAVEAAQRSLQAFTAAGVPRGIAVAEMALGPALYDVGNTAAALAACRDLVRRGKELRERIFIGVGSYYVGRFLLRFGQPENIAEARQLALEMLAMHETSFLGVSNALLGLVLLEMGNPREAEPMLRAAIENSLLFKADFLDNWAQCLLQLGQIDGARRAIEQGLPLLEGEFGAANCAVSLYVTAAQVYQAVGDVGAAGQSLGKALRLLNQRAEMAPNADARERFLRQVPANARALMLSSSVPMMVH